MKITVQRSILTVTSTSGDMLIDGVPRYKTLELPVKDGLPGSAIPPGTFEVAIIDSPHFGRPMPLITGIPGRSEIEIHYGNFPDETRGCILIGMEHGQDEVLESRLAFDDFWLLFSTAKQVGETVTIEIQGGIPQTPSVSS